MIWLNLVLWIELPGWLSSSESTCNAGNAGSLPGWERSPGEGNDNPFQYSCLGNFMDRGARQATVHGVTKQSDMTEQLNTNNFLCSVIGESASN